MPSGPQRGLGSGKRAEELPHLADAHLGRSGHQRTVHLAVVVWAAPRRSGSEPWPPGCRWTHSSSRVRALCPSQLSPFDRLRCESHEGQRSTTWDARSRIGTHVGAPVRGPLPFSREKRRKRARTGLRQKARAVRLRPDDQGRTTIEPFDRRAFVAARLQQPLAVGPLRIEPACRHQLPRQQWEMRHSRQKRRPDAPNRRAGNRCRRYRRVRTRRSAMSSTTSCVAVVPTRTCLLHAHDRRVQGATGTLRRRRQHAPDRRIHVLQRAEREARRAVIVLQEPDQLAAPAPGSRHLAYRVRLR